MKISARTARPIGTIIACALCLLASSCNIFTFLNTVEKPCFDPPGGVYPAALQVSISCPTPEAEIYYTLDGSDPTEASIPYAGPIDVTANVAIQARCYRDGWTASQAVCGRYVLATPQVEDATIYYDDQDFNDGAVERLKVGYYYSFMLGNLVSDDRALVRFDLSAIPGGSTVSSAKLKLFYDSGPNPLPTLKKLYLHKLAGPWQEATVTWGNQPAWMQRTSTALIPEELNQWVVWDVSDDVQGFIYGTWPNHGWGIRYLGWTEIVNMTFRSREYSVAEQRPTLEIYFSGKTEPLIIR